MTNYIDKEKTKYINWDYFKVTDEILEQYSEVMFRSANREVSDQKASQKLEEFKIDKFYKNTGTVASPNFEETDEPEKVDLFWGNFWAAIIFQFCIFGGFLSSQTHLAVGELWVNIEWFKATGRKNLVTTVFRDTMAKLLVKHNNVIINKLMKDHGLLIFDEQRRYMFSKGYLLGDGLLEINSIKHDLEYILQNIKKKIHVEKLEFLKFYQYDWENKKIVTGLFYNKKVA